MLLYIPSIDIPTSAGWVHLQSSWFVGTTPDVTEDTAVWTSLNDDKHLTSITCDYSFSPDITYYSKVRIICNNGIIDSDAGIIKVTDPVEVSFKYKLPSIVVTPTIEIVGDDEKVNNSLFTVNVSDISTTSNSELEHVSYIIEDLKGEAVYSSLVDKDNLKSKSFSDVILENGKPYILRVSQHSTSGDSSPFASALFYVPSLKEINLTTKTDNVNFNEGYTMLIGAVENFKSMRIDVYAAGLGKAKHVFSHAGTSHGYSIPATVFNSKTDTYILGIKVTKKDNSIIGTKYYQLTSI